MYLRANKRIKDGKEHRYWSVEESLRLRSGRPRSKRGGPSASYPCACPERERKSPPQTFTFQLDKEKLQKAELRDGHYLLRSNLVGENPEVLWERYIQLT